MALLVLDFTIFLAMSLATAQASRAADDCLSKPNAAAPPGSHWYYRVDRATQRECWYLGAEGAKVRSPARQDASPVRPQSSKLSAQPCGKKHAQVTKLQPPKSRPRKRYSSKGPIEWRGRAEAFLGFALVDGYDKIPFPRA